MAKYVIDESTLTAIADSIRAKTGGTESIFPENMPTEIANVKHGLRGVSYIGNEEITEITEDCSEYTTAYKMFEGCTSLDTVVMTNTENIKNWSNFAASSSIVNLATLDWSSATNVNFAFVDCVALEELRFVASTVKLDFDLSTSPLLSAESLYSIHDAVVDVGEARSCIIASEIWNGEMFEVADAIMMSLMDKNWYLS